MSATLVAGHPKNICTISHSNQASRFLHDDFSSFFFLLVAMMNPEVAIEWN